MRGCLQWRAFAHQDGKISFDKHEALTSGSFSRFVMAKRRVVSRVIHGPAGPQSTKVTVIDLALAHARSSKPGSIPTIVEVNDALRAGAGGSWFPETWEACWLTADEYAEFARRAKRRQAERQRTKRKPKRDE